MGQLTKSYNEQVQYYDEALQDYVKSYQYDHDNVETIRCQGRFEQAHEQTIKGLWVMRYGV